MKFTKMQGLGNDYVYVNGFEERIENPSEMAVKVSNRNFGVGSDGLILINPSEKADFEMEMYNADGSRGEMCGNGIRCVAKYVYDYGLTDKTHISVETLGGIKYLDLTVEDGKVVLVRVDMGSPILTPAQIPVIADEAEAVAVPILVDETEYQMTCVSMGNPHAVIFMDDIEHLEIEKIGPKFEHHERFPNRVNTEFVKVLDRHTASMRVCERVTVSWSGNNSTARTRAGTSHERKGASVSSSRITSSRKGSLTFAASGTRGRTSYSAVLDCVS